MPLLNPPLPEVLHTEVELYFDLDPFKTGVTTGTYLIEISFNPGYKLISPPPLSSFIPIPFLDGEVTNLMDSIELITAFENAGYQEKTLLILLGHSHKPDSIKQPQDQILLIHFREMNSNQLIETKTKVLYYLKAKDKPKRINYIHSTQRDFKRISKK